MNLRSEHEGDKVAHVHGVTTGSSTSIKVEGLSPFVSIEDQVEISAIIISYRIWLENKRMN